MASSSKTKSTKKSFCFKLPRFLLKIYVNNKIQVFNFGEKELDLITQTVYENFSNSQMKNLSFNFYVQDRYSKQDETNNFFIYFNKRNINIPKSS